MRAVIYTRVSTKEQSEEGYSLAAQRDACARWINDHDGDVVDEYCDAGESARSADRPQFQALLARLDADHSIDALVIHKLDRLARNLEDHAAVRAHLRRLEVQLVSVTENLDPNPSGRLVESILAGMSEFYSANLSQEVRKGQLQKLKAGGWPGRAPVGYRNVRPAPGQSSVLEVDPEQAPLVRLAFELYATGDWPLRELRAHLVDQGLQGMQGPVSRSKLALVLQNQLYIGVLRWRGMEFPGTHEPLVTVELFEAVQQVLEAKGRQGRQRRHDHHLRGVLVCAGCGSRLCLTIAKGRFPYYFCLGAQRQPSSCDAPHVPVRRAEELVAMLHAANQLPAGLVQPLERAIEDEIRRRLGAQGARRQQAAAELDQLRRTRQKLLTAYLEDAIDVVELKREQSRLRSAERLVMSALDQDEPKLRAAQARLHEALELAKSANYSALPHRQQGSLNQAMLERVRIAKDEITSVDYREPFATLVAAGSSNDLLVGAEGLEPPTSSL